MNKNELFMRMALQEATLASEAGEIPVGAVLTCGDRVIARAHNQTETLQDATAHAEMLALTAGMAYMSSKYLPECHLYVSLEPCIMCAGAIGLSQIKQLHYAAGDEKRGYRQYGVKILHPKTEVFSGLFESESEALLKTFFKARRKSQGI
ncbi:MAG: nucleoside deaminase [Bacteroidales bacterium]